MTKEFIQENLLTVQGKLNNHAIKKHKVKASAEELYSIYKDTKPKLCSLCNSNHKFMGFWQGYKDICSNKKCKSVSDRRKATCLKRYGVETCIVLPEVKKKSLSIASNKESRAKAKATCMERYGVENPSQSEEIKLKKEETCLINHGVRYIQQSPNFMPYKHKEYKMPSGDIRFYQGYEDKLFDELLLEYPEDEILTDRKDIPEFWYIGNDNKKHRYFPDAFIIKTNTIYEVKSEYTLSHNKIVNELKFKSVTDNGYNFELKVY